MGKPPLMGRVKTRLAADIGPARAVAFYRLSVSRLLARLWAPRRWSLRLAVNAVPGARFSAWPARVSRLPQGGGDLGDRMAHVLHALPPGPAVLIGSDSPQVEPDDIERAFGALGRHDAVFGPSPDGGYWLIGLKRRRPAPGLFSGVRWSTERALGDTQNSLPPSFSVGWLDPLIDVDDEKDLRALRAGAGPIRFGPWRRPPR